MGEQKIYVITRHAIINHGSILQSLATISFFEKLGYSCEVIDYINEKEVFPNIINSLLSTNKNWSKNWIKRIIYKIIKYPSLSIGTKKFAKYRNELLKMTRPFTSLSELKEYEFGDGVLCSGSDQLWGPISDGSFDTAYFLDFGKNNTKIAFSSSIGRSVSYDSKISHLLSNYEWISTREIQAADFIKKNYNDNVFNIYDPTLMVESQFWIDFINNDKINDDYVLVYKIHENKEFENFIKCFSKKKKIKVRRIINALDDFSSYGKKEFLVHPKRFLSLIKNAKYILTDSFHCVQFSVIFQKKFMVVSPGKTSVRITDFLSEIGMLNNYVDTSFDLDFFEKQSLNYDDALKIINMKKNKYIQTIKSKIHDLKVE